MDSLLLDRTTWDLCKDANGNIAVASDPYAIIQNVACACRLFVGELYFNTAKGVPYWESILGQRPPIEFFKSKLEEAALTVAGVAKARCMVASFTGRKLTGQMQIIDTNGVEQHVGF